MGLTMNDLHKLLRRKAAAEYIGVSTTTLDRLTSRGCIAYISVPSSGKAGKPSRAWTVGDLNDFIDSRRRVCKTNESTSIGLRNRKHGKVKSQTLPESATAILRGESL